MSMRVLLLALLAAAGAATADHDTVAAQEPNRGGQIDLASQDPAVALSRFRVQEGYEISLFASEREFPEIAKPVAMTFDTRGRLWVLTSPTYPHYLPGTPPHDKLVILEDTDADGRADRSTVFADGLYIPTGFELGDGGAYVSQQPNLMFLRDTDGDDRADERRIVLHGFGTEDSHHSIHTFTWGPDGALYFQEGTFLHSQVETPYGPVRLRDAGVFRYEPRTEKLSVFVSYPFANPWGHVVDAWGQNFISDASNGANYYGTAFSGHVDYPQKQRPLKEWTLTRVRPTCGIEFVRSRHFPDEAQGNFLYNNVIGFQGIKQYKVSDDGAGFVAVETEPLLQSTDPNFRPIALQFGPDGALYVADWFNPLIGHMQYSLRDPRRDTQHGRVWRITATGRPLLARARIAGAPMDEQLDLLKAYEDRTRYRARLALRDRPTPEVTKALAAWTAALDPADPLHEHHLLEALWVYQHHDVVNPELLDRLLRARDFRARAAAVRVLHHWLDRVDGGFPRLAAMVRDEAPRVRLEAVRALSFVPTPASAEAALEALRAPADYYLQYVLDSTLETLQKVWKPVLTSGRPFAPANPEGLAFVLARLSPEELVALPRSAPVYHAILSARGIDVQHRREAVAGLARLNGTTPLGELLTAIERVDGKPGSSHASRDLAALLVTLEPPSLAQARTRLSGLAVSARSDDVRRGAYAAVVRADGGIDGVWPLAGASAARRIDLLGAASLVQDPAARAGLYDKVASVISTAAAGSRSELPAIRGRFVRLVIPGRRVLSLNEVEVLVRGENVAPKGTATQSSTVAGGAIGGHAPNAIDGRTERDHGGGSVSFTSLEQDPWWEVDLGVERPIEALRIHPAAGAAAEDALHVTVLDSTRNAVFTRDGVALAAGPAVLPLGGDLTTVLLEAAARAVAELRGMHPHPAALLLPLVERTDTSDAAVAALARVEEGGWPDEMVPRLTAAILAHLERVPPAQRTGEAYTRAVALARTVSARLPAAERERAARTLGGLVVRVIRIEAVPAEMRFDLSQFTVAAGEDVEIVFVNNDDMPHNLLVTVQQALESVALKAEAMAQQPDGFEKQFVPETAEVLWATPLINRGETARLRFRAPEAPGPYPYVCTFPGHWRTMNGTMTVVAPAVTGGR